MTHTRRRPVVRAAVRGAAWAGLVVLTAPGPAAAYPGEADGWGGVRWGDSAAALLQKRPGLLKRGYRLGGVNEGMRKSEGGIFLDETVPAYGWDEAVVRWSVRKDEGVFKAEIDLEDLSPRGALSPRKVLASLTEAHGPPGTDREGNSVWPGQATVIVFTPHRVVSGAHCVVRHVRRSEWDETEVTLPPGWGDSAAPAAATPPPPAPAAPAAPAAAPPARAAHVSSPVATPDAAATPKSEAPPASPPRAPPAAPDVDDAERMFDGAVE